jgi:multidrug resistance efflux pump
LCLQQTQEGKTGRPWRVVTAVALILGAVQAQAQAGPGPMLTGEVFSLQAQEIIVPLTTNWQSRISRLVPEGSFVENGDQVVEFDGTEAARQLEQQRETSRTEQARTERDLARLEKEVAQARYQLKIAEIDLELATLKAEIPEGVIGGIEYAENQLAFEQATNGLENAREQFDDRSKSLRERQRQAALDERKLEVQEAWWAQMLESFSIEAAQPGYVIYGNHPWTRAKFQEGDSVQTSFRVAQIANTANLAVKVWINGVDRPALAEGDAVRVRFDALPGEVFDGEITQLLASGTQRQEWGKADYYEGVVTLAGGGDGSLLPGMSALVEVMP